MNTTVTDTETDNKKEIYNDKVEQDVILTNGYQELISDKYELIIKDLKDGHKKDIDFLQKHHLNDRHSILNDKMTETFNLTNQLNQVTGDLNCSIKESKKNLLIICKLKNDIEDLNSIIKLIRQELKSAVNKAHESWTLFRKYSPEGYKTYLLETYGHGSISEKLIEELDQEINYNYSKQLHVTSTYGTSAYGTSTYDTNVNLYDNKYHVTAHKESIWNR
jgi:hypothetical protein